MRCRSGTLEQLVWELRRAFRELAETADGELDALGLQAADRALLEFLAREEAPVSLSDLARKYALSRQHIQQTLRRLPHPEWIEESADPADRRIVLLRLSRQGRAKWEQIRKADRAFFQKLGGRLAEEEVVSATELLRKLRRELQAETEASGERA